MALISFARGSPVDIFFVHGGSHCEVFRGAWIVVDVVNQCESLAISFPSHHMEQQELAAEFFAATVDVHHRSQLTVCPKFHSPSLCVPHPSPLFPSFTFSVCPTPISAIPPVRADWLVI